MIYTDKGGHIHNIERIDWKAVTKGYMMLAARIVDSGRREGDRVFLEGEWCAELREAVVEWINNHGKTEYSVGRE